MAAAAITSQAAAGDASTPFFGKWRITRAVVAPWTDEAGAGAQPAWIGTGVTFGEHFVKGPHPIGCRNAAYEPTNVPPEGLFQGAELSMAQINSLGLGGGAFTGFSVSCDAGVFEYHFADDDTLLLALDNRIWTLDRTDGARAAKSSPEGVVQRFLEAHFADHMGFTKETVSAKRATMTKALNEKIRAYFAAPGDPDDAPAINGDPFTDTQEYPTRFAVRSNNLSAEGIVIPVEFADAFAKRTVLFELKRQNGRWLINDLIYDDGSRLTALLSGQRAGRKSGTRFFEKSGAQIDELEHQARF